MDINTTIQKYNEIISANKNHIEFELRIKHIDKNNFQNILKIGKFDLTTSIDFIQHEQNYKKIRTITNSYKNNVLISADSYSTKTNLVRKHTTIDSVPVLISIAEESPIQKIDISSSALVRFKIRYSTTIDKWRIDVTAVKQYDTLTEIQKNIKTIRDEIFSKNLYNADHNKSAENINHDLINQYELEAEFVGKVLTADDFGIVKKIYETLYPNAAADLLYKNELYSVARYMNLKLSHPTLKQLGNKVINFDKNIYYAGVFPLQNYFVTDKADGVRCIITVHDSTCYIISHALPGNIATFPVSPAADIDITAMIVDAEIFVEKNMVTDIYIFDVIQYITPANNDNISALDIENRITYISAAVDVLKTVLPEVKVLGKKYIKLSNPDELENNLRGIWDNRNKLPYECDGLIFTKPGDNYLNTINYKWKPIENTTIDFYAKQYPGDISEELLSAEQIKMLKADSKLVVYILFVGINEDNIKTYGLHKIFPKLPEQNNSAKYVPIQFSPSANPRAFIHVDKSGYDGKIIELGKDADTGDLIFAPWKLVRVRDDRTINDGYGNDFRVAELVFNNYIDIFKFEDLYKKSNAYFSDVADKSWANSNRYKRFCITDYVNIYFALIGFLVDLASGRGSEVFRYSDAKIAEVLFIDRDARAIVELIRRKFANKNPINIHVMKEDLTKNFNEILADMYMFNVAGGVDGVICNFAIHYFCDDSANIENILKLAARLLKKDSHFMFTTMDGEKVFKLLADTPVWSGVDDGNEKYKITKLYKTDKLENVGQLIKIKLPFTAEEYSEPLCNIDYVIKLAKKYGFDLVVRASMLSEKQYNINLSAIDKQYIDLHSVVILKKTVNKKSII